MSPLRLDFDELAFEPDGSCTRGGEPFTGTAVERWPEGPLRAEEEYLWGRRCGRSRQWSRAGQLLEDASLWDGVADGVSRGWHADGRLAYETRSESGIQLASRSWDDAGRLTAAQTIDVSSPEQARLLKLRAAEAAATARRTRGALPVWREVTFDYGDAHDPVSPVGRVVIELLQDGLVFVTHLRAQRRDWRARQTAQLWPRVLEALARAHFPVRPDAPAILPPGTSRLTVAARSTYGDRAHVEFPTGVAFVGYRELTGLMMSVAAQTSPDILGAALPAVEPTLVEAVVGGQPAAR